jgi:seipin
VAVVAYILFYYSYIPRIGFEREIHLQFDDVYTSRNPQATGLHAHPYPYGTVSLAPDIVSEQGYDIKIELEVPRTRPNREAGNFMLEVLLLGAGEPQKTTGRILDTVREGFAPGGGAADGATVLARSRRPAMLKYRSWIVEHVYRLTELHWYLLGFRNEDETLTVQVFERVEFRKGWRNVPATLRLEIQSQGRMQVYGAKALFRARFAGIRWLMYNWKIFSAVVFVMGFWSTEMVFTALAWAAVAAMMASADPLQAAKTEDEDRYDRAGKLKAEGEDEEKVVLSDTDRTFPTTSKQHPLRYLSPEVKREEQEPVMPLREVAPVGGEADDEDEDEDADFFLDSGIGTSMESSAGRTGSVKRRRGRDGGR